MYKILITGGAGFIGSNLANFLNELGHQVIVVDDGSNGNFDRLNNGIEINKIDILDYVKENSLTSYDYVFHFACIVIRDSDNNPELDLNVNALSTLRILDKLKESTNIKKFVLASSSSVYGTAEELPITEKTPINIQSLYAGTKFLAENYCNHYNKHYNIPTAILRFSNIYGYNQDTSVPWTGVIGKFINEIKDNKLIYVYGDGTAKRDYTFIEDAISAIFMVTFSNVNGEIYNVSNNVSFSISEIINILKTHLGEFEVIHVGSGITDNIPDRLVSYKKISTDLQWTPIITLQEGIKRLI